MYWFGYAQAHYGTADWKTALALEEETLGDEMEYFESDMTEVQRIIGCNSMHRPIHSHSISPGVPR